MALRPALLLALAVLAPAAPARAADELLAPGTEVRHVTAYGGALAWSHAVAGGYAIAIRREEIVTDLPLHVFSPGFQPDPDLGPTAHGGLAVVASRCAARSCSLITYSLQTGGSRRVPGVARLGCRGLIAPSYWRGAVAFIGLRCGRHRTAGLYLRAAGGELRRLRSLSADASDETDLRGTLLAYRQTADRGAASEIRVLSIRTGRSRLAARADRFPGIGSTVTSPAFDGSFVYWMRTQDDQAGTTQAIEGAASATAGSTGVCESRAFVEPAPDGEPARIAWNVALDRGRAFYAVVDEGIYLDRDQPPDGRYCQAAP